MYRGQSCLKILGKRGDFRFRSYEIFFREFAQLGVGAAIREEGVQLCEGAGGCIERGEGGCYGLQLADAFGEFAVEGVAGFCT